jgi:hypothetical protein
MATLKEISQSVAGFVAPLLSEVTGETWVADDMHPASVGIYMRHVRTGAHVHVRPDERKSDRVVFSATYPKSEVWPKPEALSIGANRYKSPDKLAQDVARRLVPEYLKEWERVTASNREDDAMALVRSAHLKGLAEAFEFPVTYGPNEPKHRSAEMSWYVRDAGATGDNMSGSAKVSYRADKVELTLSDLTPEDACEVLKVVRDGIKFRTA